MLTKISTILKSLNVNYQVSGERDSYMIGNIQENRLKNAFNEAANGEFIAYTTAEMYPGDHVKNRDLGDIIITTPNREVVASIDLKVATFSSDPGIYGPISMSSAYMFSGWNGDRKNTFYMLVNGANHSDVKFISVADIINLLDGGKVKVLFSKGPITNRILAESYAARGWDKNILNKSSRSWLADEDYIGSKTLYRHTSDVMC